MFYASNNASAVTMLLPLSYQCIQRFELSLFDFPILRLIIRQKMYWTLDCYETLIFTRLIKHWRFVGERNDTETIRIVFKRVRSKHVSRVNKIFTLNVQISLSFFFISCFFFFFLFFFQCNITMYLFFYLYKYISIKIIFSQQRKLTTYRFFAHSLFLLYPLVRSFARLRTYTLPTRAHSSSLRSCLPAMSFSVPLLNWIGRDWDRSRSIARHAGYCRFGKKKTRACIGMCSRSMSVRIRYSP